MLTNFLYVIIILLAMLARDNTISSSGTRLSLLYDNLFWPGAMPSSPSGTRLSQYDKVCHHERASMEQLSTPFVHILVHVDSSNRQYFSDPLVACNKLRCIKSFVDLIL